MMIEILWVIIFLVCLVSLLFVMYFSFMRNQEVIMFSSLCLITALVSGLYLVKCVSKKEGERVFAFMSASEIQEKMVYRVKEFRFENRGFTIYTCPASKMINGEISEKDYAKLEEVCEGVDNAMAASQSAPPKNGGTITLLTKEQTQITVKNAGKKICTVNRNSGRIGPFEGQAFKDFIKNAPICKAAALKINS